MFDEALMSRDFHLAFQQLHPQKREIVKRKVDLLLDNPRHRSLNVHRLRQANRQIWDCYIDRGHGGTRLLYETQGKRLLLWRLGHHDLIDHVRQLIFDPSAQFLNWESQTRRVASPASLLDVTRETPLALDGGACVSGSVAQAEDEAEREGNWLEKLSASRRKD